MASTSAPLCRSFLVVEVGNKERSKSLVLVCAKMFNTAMFKYLITFTLLFAAGEPQL
jgi:hypothetical protein